jgi:hypothetical protein
VAPSIQSELRDTSFRLRIWEIQKSYNFSPIILCEVSLIIFSDTGDDLITLLAISTTHDMTSSWGSTRFINPIAKARWAKTAFSDATAQVFIFHHDTLP